MNASATRLTHPDHRDPQSLHELVTECEYQVRRRLKRWACSETPVSTELHWHTPTGPSAVSCEAVGVKGGEHRCETIIHLRLSPGQRSSSREHTDRTAAAASKLQSLPWNEREQFRAMLTSMSEGAIATDESGRITFMNAVAEQVTGWTCKEAMGQAVQTVFRLTDDEADEALETGRDLPTSGGQDQRQQATLLSRDGAKYPIDHSHAPIRDAAGGVRGTVIVFHDVTTRKRAEFQLRLRNQWLKERVAERAATAERRAGQLRALAAELTQTEQRERRRLAKALHDDLQQLLVAARMKATVLSSSADLQQLHNGISQLDYLLRESIDISRSLAADLSPPILYDAGLTAALSWLSRRMRDQHQLQVEVDAGSDAEPGSESVRVLLFQAARELLMNVVRHAKTEHARIVLERMDDHVRLTVQDAGRGFDPAALEQGGATGFGLFNIRERLQMLGGRLQIDSAVGSGTRLTATAPLRDAEDPEQAEQAIAAVQKSAARSTKSENDGIGVLVIDDHRVMRQGLANMLRTTPGVRVIGEASGGAEGIELARQLHPDIVIMDITMPGMNGIEATRRIIREMPGVKVIGLSMHDEQEIATAMLRAGAAHYLQKDGPADDLIEAIFKIARPTSADHD